MFFDLKYSLTRLFKVAEKSRRVAGKVTAFVSFIILLRMPAAVNGREVNRIYQHRRKTAGKGLGGFYALYNKHSVYKFIASILRLRSDNA
jgi:hypothetical protein